MVLEWERKICRDPGPGADWGIGMWWDLCRKSKQAKAGKVHSREIRSLWALTPLSWEKPGRSVHREWYDQTDISKELLGFGLECEFWEQRETTRISMAGSRWDERALSKESLCRFWRAFKGRANRIWSGPGYSRSMIQTQGGWKTGLKAWHCPAHLWVGCGLRDRFLYCGRL